VIIGSERMRSYGQYPNRLVVLALGTFAGRDLLPPEDQLLEQAARQTVRAGQLVIGVYGERLLRALPPIYIDPPILMKKRLERLDEDERVTAVFPVQDALWSNVGHAGAATLSLVEPAIFVDDYLYPGRNVFPDGTDTYITERGARIHVVQAVMPGTGTAP
jgi:hypothetical protein